MSEFLIDLDVLVLKCKDEEARKYISEAIACYKAGAFRACIVNTWIAIIYDFVYKLRQLELTGDKNAIAKLQEFEAARTSKTPEFALKFEKKILDWARDEFEFISPIQFNDLERLLEDRNRCAHPSMISAEEIYQPPAELARYHLRNAVLHLLQHPPVQGKAALDRLTNETLSEYFPTEVREAVEYLRHGPLANSKFSLVRNFIVVLLKKLLNENCDDKAWQRFVAALNAVRQLHRASTEQVFREQLSGIIQRLPDGDLHRTVKFLKDVPDTWQHLIADAHIKLQNYVVHLSETLIWVLPIALDIPELKANALLRLQTLSADNLTTLIRWQPRKEYRERALALYADAGSFQHAHRMGINLIIPLMEVFEKTHLQQIISLAIPPYQDKYPNQIYHSSSFATTVIPAIKSVHNLTEEQFEELLSPLHAAYPNDDWLGTMT